MAMMAALTRTTGSDIEGPGADATMEKAIPKATTIATMSLMVTVMVVTVAVVFTLVVFGILSLVVSCQQLEWGDHTYGKDMDLRVSYDLGRLVEVSCQRPPFMSGWNLYA